MPKNRLIITRDGKESVIWLPQKIILTLPAYGEMLLAASFCPVEVSGYAEVKKEGDDCKVYNVIIPHQVCLGTLTSSFGDNLHSAMREIVEQGKDPGDFYCWWHSHVDMPAVFSETDLFAIYEFQRYLLRGNRSEIIGPWISVVLNKRAEISGRCDFAKPSFSLWDLPVVLEDGVGEEDIQHYIDVHQFRVAEILRNRIKMYPLGGK